MALDVFISGKGVLELEVNRSSQTIFQSCCGRSIGPSPVCNTKIYSASITVTNDPANSIYGGNNPNVLLYIVPILLGNPINLDCTNANGIPVEPGNSKTIILSTSFDEIRVSAVGDAPLGEIQTGSYFLSIGTCTT